MKNIPDHKNKRHPIYVWEWREQRGLTGKELSEICGYDQGTISAIETGARRANLDHLSAIAQSLDISIGQLFRSPEDPLAILEGIYLSLPDSEKEKSIQLLEAFAQ